MYCYFAVISALFSTTPAVFSNATLTRNLTEFNAALIGHNSNAAPGCGSINCKYVCKFTMQVMENRKTPLNNYVVFGTDTRIV